MKLIIFTSTCLNTSSGSVLTTLNILDNLPESYKVTLILMDSLVTEEKKMIQVGNTLVSKMIDHPRVVAVEDLSEMSISDLKETGDSAIVAIYNYFGEDGAIPALCEMAGIKILSSASSSSSLCFNKEWTRKIMSASGINVARGIVLEAGDKRVIFKAKKFFSETGKMIVKPLTCGASRGCSVCRNQDEIEAAINAVFEFSDQALCEEFIEGREYTVGFIKNNSEVKLLPPVEIITNRDFFDYTAKYDCKNTREICPTDSLSDDSLIEIYQIVKAIIKSFNLSSHGRIDFIISNGKIFVLEINTFPGLMKNSLFPKELEAAGISLGGFISDYFSETNKVKSDKILTYNEA